MFIPRLLPLAKKIISPHLSIDEKKKHTCQNLLTYPSINPGTR
jgi:hypothetical protein